MKFSIKVVMTGVFLGMAACGGGGDKKRGEPAFVVPPQPASLAAASGMNQAPPPELMNDALVPLIAARRPPLTPEERSDAAAAARGDALDYMRGAGFGGDDDVETTRVQRDPYGGVHVKMSQTHQGVPVLGSGVGCHTMDGRSPAITDNLVRGLDLDVRNAVSQMDAEAAAGSEYLLLGTTSPDVPTTTSSRLVICPTLEWQKRRADHARDNTADFDRVLTAARLCWEVVVAPKLTDDADLFAAIAEDPPGQDQDDDDEETAKSRRENGVRGAIEEDEGPEADDHTLAAILQPAARILVDALTGEIVETQTLVDRDDYAPAHGVGHSYASGIVPLSTAYKAANDTFYLVDLHRPDTSDGKFGTYILDAKNVETHSSGDMRFIRDWNNVWGDASIYNSEGSLYDSARRQTPGVDVAHGIQMTWDFLENVLSRWGPDGDGTRTRACVHYGDGYGDAHYNASSTFICFGDGSTLAGAGNYGLGTVAHELGHAFWHAAGNGTDASEAKALNEGQGDILGGLVALYRATGRGTGNQVRRFSNFANWRGRVVNPEGYSETDDDVTYGGLRYWSPSLADGPEHVGGLPYARAMIYLAEGAPDDLDDTLWTSEYPLGLGGIGITYAAKIWHFATAYLIVGTPDYQDMRDAFELAATWLFGVDSMPVRAVRRAFAAIRVGAGDVDTQNPDFLYAQVFGVNTKDMTAGIFAIPTDDTGFRELRVNGSSNNGHYEGDIFLGFADISGAGVGLRDFTFTIEDSAGKTASVQRSFVKPRDRNLITNGSFESGMSGWTTLFGENRVASFAPNAFIGNGYATMEGLDVLWQEVTIPPTAENVCLVFRVLVRDSTQAGETLKAQVHTTGGSVLQTLRTFDINTPADTRDWINKGFLRQEFDLSAYAGDTVRIAFLNVTESGRNRFVVDQVVLTYEEDVSVGLPVVEVAPWDDTVSFTLPDIEGLQNNEIDRVDWYIDNVFVGAGPISNTDWFGSWFLSSLTPGAHWVAGRVRGLDNTILVDTQAVWFETGNPPSELLDDGGFESGAWNLTYSDPPPKVQIVPNGAHPIVAFQGDHAIKLGGLGEDDQTRIGQAVQMPHQMASLTLSVRVKAVSAEVDVDGTPEDDDSLWVELWDLGTFTKIGEHMVAHFTDVYYWQGIDHGWRGYVRKEVSIPAWSVAGKNVMIRLFTKETPSLPTTFYIDNVSLRYTQFGVNMGG